jgi:hypothetical protein
LTAPAFYVIRSDRLWARWLNVLHWPFTAWHLSYVAIGASMAGEVRWDVLGWTVLAFFLAMGVGAHCFDLVRGDPLALGLSRSNLVLVGGVGVAAAVGIGSTQTLLQNVPAWLGFALPIGVLMAMGYGFEWRWMHGNVQFALFWAVFPFLVGLAAMDDAASWGGSLLMVLFVFATAYAQRALSTRARYLRREITVANVYLSPVDMPEGIDPLKFSHPGPEGRISRWPAQEQDKAWLLEPIDQALMIMSFAMPALAAGMLLWRL